MQPQCYKKKRQTDLTSSLASHTSQNGDPLLQKVTLPQKIRWKPFLSSAYLYTGLLQHMDTKQNIQDTIMNGENCFKHIKIIISKLIYRFIVIQMIQVRATVELNRHILKLIWTKKMNNKSNIQMGS